MRRLLALLVLAGCAHASPAGQTSVTEARSALPAERVVSATVDAPPSITPGGRGEIEVTLRIAPDYHVMSDHPSNPLYIPTRVTFEGQPFVSFDDTVFPAPRHFALGDESIPTFEGEIHARVPFAIQAQAAPGTYELSGALQYQSCTRTSCLFPVKRPLRAALTISP